MKIAIMQPYIFPYLGYFQLIAAADKFVILDDVNFIRRGWIHRNCFLDRSSRIISWTIPLIRPSSRRLISEHEIAVEDRRWKKLPATIRAVYARAPQFDRLWPDIELLFDQADCNLSRFALSTIKFITKHLDIKTNIIETSCIYNNSSHQGQERILDICRIEGASTYINAEGGKSLYEKKVFAENGIRLKFLSYKTIPYQQWCNNNFVDKLSILDSLMFNERCKAKKLLLEFAN